jgi:hypothetical protein
MSDVSQNHALHADGETSAPAWVRNLAELSPSLAAAAYPFLLRGFHAGMTWSENGPTLLNMVSAAVFMALAFAVPAMAFVFAYRKAGIARPTAFQVKARRLAYLTVGVPPLYVLFGVLDTFAGKPVSPEWAWAFVWVAGCLWASASGPASQVPVQAAKSPAAPSHGSKAIGKLRVGHGIVAAIVLAFIAFHLANHMVALNGPEAHAAVMDAGRKVYREPAVEIILVTLLLLQVAGGVTLAWRWSALPADIYRVFQVASGAYLACFILCHLNSIFVGARLIWEIPTDWAFMTSQPTGLLHSAGSLLPHYTLGVFFVLSHLISGLRHVSLTHGLNRIVVNRLWGVGVAMSMIIAVTIMAGLCGATLGKN